MILVHLFAMRASNLISLLSICCSRKTSQRKSLLVTCFVSVSCPPLESSSVNVKCNHKGNNVLCGKAMAPGTVASLECKVSYQLTFEPGYSKITCLQDGKWDKPLFTCTPGQLGFMWFLIYPKININIQILSNIRNRLSPQQNLNTSD
jgi:hypothetical protein